MVNIDDSASKAHLPIEGLHELGHTREAIRYIKRFLKRLPSTVNVQTVMMHELAAEILLSVGDDAGTQKHLCAILKLDKSGARKCDRDFPEKSVHKFRVQHGLLDPADAQDSEEADEAEFNRARRLANTLARQRSYADAAKQAAIMERIAKATEDEFFRSIRFQETLTLYARIHDEKATRRILRRLDADERDEVLGYEELQKLGMQREAVRRAERQIESDLEELAEMDSPNIHFPVDSLHRALIFLVDHDETNRARRLLKRVLSQCDEWPVYEFGWTTSAVYAMLARSVASINGPDAATEWMERAYEDASAEKRGEWRKASLRGAIKLQADIGLLDEAIERAKRLRSPRERRRETAKLLARAKRWKALREVCRGVTSPEEAADLCWEIKRELPAGQIQ